MEDQKRVLVVDDNRTLVLIAERVLKKEGYDVITALSGAEGLEKALKEKPDLIILDIVMPKMDGYEVGRQLKLNPDTANTPIIFLSARGNTDETEGATALGLQEIEKAFKCGGNDFLHKPVPAAELIKVVKDTLWFSKVTPAI